MLTAVACASRNEPGPVPGKAQESIGVATMAADGTITMKLRAAGPGGVSGEGLFTYRPQDPDYDRVLKHLGAMRPGDIVPVKPFPDEP